MKSKLFFFSLVLEPFSYSVALALRAAGIPCHSMVGCPQREH